MCVCVCVCVRVGMSVCICVCVGVYLFDKSCHVQGSERGLFSRFDHHSVPRAQSRSDLPSKHHHWEIPLQTQTHNHYSFEAMNIYIET